MSALVLRWRVPSQAATLAPLAAIVGPPGRGVPRGGSEAQILRKVSAGDYDAAWTDLEIALIPGLDDELAGKAAAEHTHAQSDVTGLAAALALLAPLASAALTGNPTAPTQSAGNNSTRIANTAFVKTAIDDLIAGAPGALDTLGEIAAQLADDEDAIAALVASIALKADRYGADAVQNGGFDSEDYWSIYADNTGAPTIAAGVFTADPTDYCYAYQDFAEQAGPGIGKLVYTIVSMTTGTVDCDAGGVAATQRTAPGTYSEELSYESGASYLNFTFAETDAVIDNVQFIPPGVVLPESLTALYAALAGKADTSSLGSMAAQSASAVNITGGGAALQLGACTFADQAGFRTALGLGSIATQDANNVNIAGSFGGQLGACTFANATTFRTELGLGSMALQFSNAVAITGGSATGLATLAVVGNCDVGGAYRVDGVRVVSNRVTGWSSPTGTASRAAYDTATVTTAQLAQRLKALIDDLIAHGLIGV